MAYRTNSKIVPARVDWVTKYNGVPLTGSQYTGFSITNAVIDQDYTSGSNVNSQLYKIANFAAGNYIKVAKQKRVGREQYLVERGTSYRRKDGSWSFAKQDYYRWRYVYITYWKHVFKRKKKVLLKNLLPNSFNVTNVKMRELPGSSQLLKATNLQVPLYSREISGPMALRTDSFYPGWTISPIWWGIGSIDIYGATGYTSKMESLYKTAKNRSIAKMKSQAVNLAVFTAEFGKTKSMVIELAQRLALAPVRLKSGKFAKAFKGLFPTDSKSLANDWLMLQYGIKPLLSDIDGMAKYLASIQELRTDHISTSSDLGRLTYTRSVSNGWKGSSTLLIDWKMKVKVKVRTKMDLPLVHNAKVLGLLNPAELVWELIPFSFVVDWFLPIGDFLASSDATFGLSIEYAHRTNIFNILATETCSIGGTDSNQYKWENAIFGQAYSFTSISRVLLSTATSEWKPNFPDFKNPISGLHLANALALLRQLR